jgi:Flp pilus assembly protein TadD
LNRYSFSRSVIVLGLGALIFVQFNTSIAQTNRNVAYQPKQTLKAADKLILKGDLLEAEKMLRDSLERNPNDAGLKLKLAFSLMKMRVLGEHIP